MTEQRTVNQKSAKAGRDVVAGDQNVHHHYTAAPKATVVEQLLLKLQKEMEENAQVRAMINSLRYYYEHKSHDGVTGLEAKLEKAQRSHEIDHALAKKEQFAKNSRQVVDVRVGTRDFRASARQG